MRSYRAAIVICPNICFHFQEIKKKVIDYKLPSLGFFFGCSCAQEGAGVGNVVSPCPVPLLELIPGRCGGCGFGVRVVMNDGTVG